MNLDKQIEAILFFKGEAMSYKKLASILNVKEDDIKTSLEELKIKLEDRGIRLIFKDDKVMLATGPEAHEIIESLKKEELSKDLGKASLETLSIVLYRGPVMESEVNIAEEKIDPFEDLVLEAKSAFVWDTYENKIIYSMNGEAQLPLASLTKLMTALVVSELVPEGIIVTIDSQDINEEGDSGFLMGEKWRLADVLDFTLVSSSNDGAHALASIIGSINTGEGQTQEEMFIKEMNQKAQNLGLIQTYFLNESGLDVSQDVGGAYGSAKDVAMLMGQIIKEKPQILEATKYSSLEIKSKDFTHTVYNTNQYAEAIPGIIASKTGFTDLAGGNLVIAFDIGIGHPIIVSVLGSSREGRFKDVGKLVSASIEKVAQE